MIDERINDIDFETINDDLIEATENVKADDYDAAKEIIEELISDYIGIYKEDENERYFCFDSPIQFYLYDMQFNPKKLIRPCKIDYRSFYYCLARIDYAYEDYESAEENLKEALYYNPLDTNIFFLLASIYVKKGELNKLKIVLSAVRNYILDKISRGKYYAYLGEYYLLKKEYKVALSLYYLSQSIYETKVAEDGVSYITDNEKCSMNAPATEEIIDTLRKDGFSYKLNDEVLGMIYDLSFEMQKNLNNREAIYCLNVLYELTNDDKYRKEIEYLK